MAKEVLKISVLTGGDIQTAHLEFHEAATRGEIMCAALEALGAIGGAVRDCFPEPKGREKAIQLCCDVLNSEGGLPGYLEESKTEHWEHFRKDRREALLSFDRSKVADYLLKYGDKETSYKVRLSTDEAVRKLCCEAIVQCDDFSYEQKGRCGEWLALHGYEVPWGKHYD